ncbi:MAG: glycerol-3-phosphate 1-O-acyltransferase PlsY [bacterium]|nr:glycerol-3-phosphate 1-O-acyltransferase PlsY [bacterium]MDE0241490.1 glycerol-3-phosphate 1-O-acyltransferase PlsY [bacterium]MDE0418175.1 glycerol-3-phosphate 1-O-acyltransferase PlsY [bacterium]
MFDERMLTLDALPYLWPFLVGALAAWLVGSLPSGLIAARLAGRSDLRETGSGSVGATNVLRTAGRLPAAITLVLDYAKGMLAVMIGHDTGGPDMAVIAALFVVVGHMFNPWLRFRGGKGVATALGVTLALSWPSGLAILGVWLAVAGVTRISSVSGMASIIASPVAIWMVTSDKQYAGVMILVAVLVVVRHHANIRRLVTGKEPRIGR